MMGAVRRSLLAIALIATATIASAAENTRVTSDVTDLDRMWDNFNREAAVVGDGRFWVELRGLKLNKNDPKIGLNGYPVKRFERKRGSELTELDGGRFDLIGAYGLGQAELGIDLPLVLQESLDFADGTNSEHASFGDMVLYGKFKQELAENWAGALGLEMSIPTGRESVMLGSGDLGLNPFLSTRYQSGRLAIGGHLGFLLNTGSQPQIFNWSVQGIARGNRHFALRTEVTGQLYNDVGNTFNIISVYPGLDFNLTENFIIRPEGMAGLTYQAFDWGIGIGLVFTM